jgi:glycosyltransferase involved in cell wall biosynthesis
MGMDANMPCLTAKPIRWIVSQIGARQHYGVPRGFHYKGHLRLFYTDAWCRWGSRQMKQGSARFRAFAGRFHPDLPSDRVVSFTTDALRAKVTQGARSTTEDAYLHHLSIGADFARNVNRHLMRQNLDPAVDCFFGFDTGCLETLQLLRERNLRTVVDQIDPARVEEDLVKREIEKWPGWQRVPGRIPEEYYDRLSAEWQAASLVIVNSNWSKNALIAQGVPQQKLIVTPVAFEPASEPSPPRAVRTGPLTVLWLGTVNLRKGIQYLMEAARLLTGTDLKFIVAGPIAISDSAVRSAPANLKFVGKVSRDETRRWYRAADIFVLPTISDGFAITQIEAMAEGLPVVTTPNCGEVVTHGVDGVIVPAGDSEALARALGTLNHHRDVLAEMSYYAVRKSRTFHLPRQADEIERATLSLLREM